MRIPEHDVIVVGAGNAATCVALSAKEGGDAKFPQSREFFAIHQGIRSGHGE